MNRTQHPGTGRDRQSGARLQHEAEHTQPRKRFSVMAYLAILFGAAFLLLLMSYFMQQRQNAETTSDALKQSASAAETVRLMQEENQRLKEQVDQLESKAAALEEQLDELTGQSEALRAQNAELESARQAQSESLESLTRQADAMQWFWQIDDYYVRNYRSVARQLIQQFESLDLKDDLPAENTTPTSRFSPAARYQEIYDALY